MRPVLLSMAKTLLPSETEIGRGCGVAIIKYCILPASFRSLSVADMFTTMVPDGRRRGREREEGSSFKNCGDSMLISAKTYVSEL